MGLSLCKHCCTYCCWTKQNRISQSSTGRDFSILLLGLQNAGKTEIGWILSKRTRSQFEPTNGVQWYEVNARNVTLSVTEIGGNEEMQKLWHHYYAKAMGLIFCYDMSASPQEMQKSFDLLNKIASHPFMRGKPILLIATKSDLTSDTVQLYDIENAFALEDFANRYSSSLKSIHFNPVELSDLWDGIHWLADSLQLNHKHLQSRINYDIAIDHIATKHTIKRKPLSISFGRPNTAPSTFRPPSHESPSTTSQSNNVFRIQQSMTDQVPTTSETT